MKTNRHGGGITKPLSGLVIIALFATCNSPKKEHGSIQNSISLGETDTTIGSKIVTDELAGGVYRNRAMKYYLIVGKDTSDLSFFVAETKTGRISFDIRFKKTMTYDDQLKQLEKLVPYAVDHFRIDPDSLHLIFVSRLIMSGDPAVKVTQQYAEKYRLDSKKLSYDRVTSFLAHSKLASDWNSILKQYSIVVDTVFAEKIYFAQRKELFQESIIKSDSSSIPDKILDCMIWIRLKRKVARTT